MYIYTQWKSHIESEAFFMEWSFNALCGVSKPARCFLGSTPGGRAGLSTLISYVDQIPPNIGYEAYTIQDI